VVLFVPGQLRVRIHHVLVHLHYVRPSIHPAALRAVGLLRGERSSDQEREQQSAGRHEIFVLVDEWWNATP